MAEWTHKTCAWVLMISIVLVCLAPNVDLHPTTLRPTRAPAPVLLALHTTLQPVATAPGSLLPGFLENASRAPSPDLIEHECSRLC